MVIEGFFLTATDARYAIRDLKRVGLEPSVPTPVPPNNGRPWMVSVEVDSHALAERYTKPVGLNQVFGIVTRHNGITSQVDRV